MEESDLAIKNQYFHIPGNEALFPIEDFYPFITLDGLKLHTYRYPNESPQCLVIIFHGLHAYCNNYALLARSFAEIGCEVVAFDWRGHGKSPGSKGLLPPFNILLNDCVKFVLEMHKHYKDLPIYLSGGSLGACMCIHLQNHSKIHFIKGMILLNPALKPNIKCYCLGRCLAKTISKCFPGAHLIKADLRRFGKDQDLIEYLQANPYIYTGKIRVGTLDTTSEGMHKAVGLLDSVNTPFVVVQGSKDQAVDPVMAQVLYDKALVKDKEIWVYENVTHALIFEKEFYEILERVKRWMVERLERLSSNYSIIAE